MIMVNKNSFIHNTGLTKENSLLHLLDAISPQEENEANIIEHSKYYDDIDFNNALQSYNSKISMLSLNCQSISAKFHKLKLSNLIIISNLFIHNTGLTKENSLVHLLDAISPQEENGADIILTNVNIKKKNG